MKLSISYLSQIDNVDRCLKKINDTDVEYLHCDIMDNIFVPNNTPSFEQIKDTLLSCHKPKDIHLMVNDVKKYVDKYRELNPEYITFHLEANIDVLEMINYIKSLNIKVGLAIKPNTDLELLKRYLNIIDLIIVMSVEPGFSGQHFIIKSSNRIKELNELRKNNNYHYLIEVDGGVNIDNLNLCQGADILVIGSYITNHGNYQDQIDKIRNNA